MNNYKPYFRYLGESNIRLAGGFIIILLVNTLIGLFGTSYGVESSREALVITSQSSLFSNLICLIIGGSYSLTFFSSAMSIRADRVGYIKAAFYWGMLFSIGFGIFSFAFDSIYKFLLELLSGVPVQMYLATFWIEFGDINSSTNILRGILTNITLFTLGFAVGAIWYRLKVKTSILIFAVIPIVIVGYGINYGLKNPDKMNEIGHVALDILSTLMMNNTISSFIKVISICLLSLIGIKLLIKAPIKDYANDLI